LIIRFDLPDYPVAPIYDLNEDAYHHTDEINAPPEIENNAANKSHNNPKVPITKNDL